MNLFSLLQTLIILSVLVVVHEFGHYCVARLLGVRVLEFSVGFGPLLGRIVRKDIQYSFRAVPLGGYVKLAGMEMALEGQQTSEAADDPGSLRRQPVWKKVSIILAGPLNNLILAGVIFAVTLMTIGYPHHSDKRPIIDMVDTKTPAFEGGLSAGDRVLAVDGHQVKLWTEMTTWIRQSRGRPIVFTIRRDGQVLTRTVKPVFNPGTNSYFVGISAKLYFARLSPGRSIVEGFRQVYYYSVGLCQYLARALHGKERLQFSGPLGIMGQVDQNYKAGPWWFLMLIASLNLFLGLFNLLPIPLPLLDGGWIVIFLIEALRRREFSDEQKATAQFFGLVMMLVFFLYVTYGDVLTNIKRFINR